MKSWKEYDKKMERLQGLSPEDPEYIALATELGIGNIAERTASYEQRKAGLKLQRKLDLERKKVPIKTKLRKKDLQLFSYRDLEDIFYGMHNIELPTEMLAVMNPDELVAKLLSAGEIKRNDRHLNTGYPTEFLALAAILDENAYQRHPAMGLMRKQFLEDMAKQHKRVLPHESGKQRERLSTLDDSVKETFVDSFFRPYVPSKREEPSNPNAFHDPNIDGRSRTVYVNDIYRAFK